ncbi:MAG: NADH-quinone oxidoreductase subunit NuoH [Chloroflexota bacterium]|nr:MAG: NADH-quinone oxidoreductase subunit NuoH [Chloroflexota bacterium]
MTTVVLMALVKTIVLLVVLLTLFGFLVWVERKMIARFQIRVGPNRVGPFGLLQLLADAIKLLFKEDTLPNGANKLMHALAPAISLATALAVFAVIPFGEPVSLFGQQIELWVANVDVAVLYVMAAGALGIYGIVLGGWSSNNKYSLLGGVRSSAQLISYEISLGLALVGVVMLAGSLSLVQIVQAQSIPFILLEPLGFIVFLIAGMAESNRPPFDLPEADTELTGGYLTEYGGFKFAMFYMAEYLNMVAICALITTLYLGGWRGPWLPPLAWFVIKVAALIFLFLWLRATFPRVRYDRLMRLGWLVLLPLALVNIFVTAAWMIVLKA